MTTPLPSALAQEPLPLGSVTHTTDTTAATPLVEPPGAVLTTTDTNVTTTRVDPPPSWLHTNLRNIILLAVTVTVCYLAVIGIAEARSGLIVTFTGLASYLFAERATLKVKPDGVG